MGIVWENAATVKRKVGHRQLENTVVASERCRKFIVRKSGNFNLCFPVVLLEYILRKIYPFSEKITVAIVMTIYICFSKT